MDHTVAQRGMQLMGPADTWSRRGGEGHVHPDQLSKPRQNWQAMEQYGENLRITSGQTGVDH